MTRKELMAKLKILDLKDKEKRNSVVCSLIGCSKIQTTCFGYYCCARCGGQVGDSLGGSYAGAPETVIVGHNCDTCQTNYKKCTWKDKLYAPDPFKEGTQYEPHI